ncbi:MAG: 5'-3' exonuclease [Puniceicoccales bacterium]|jgi:DNA polymerase-1|nr:5'-3' exonuclease [Puniceicoccales bacterium]
MRVHVTDHLLIDGTNLAFRCFYGIKHLSNASALPVNAIYGFVHTLWSLEQWVQYRYLWIFFDCSRSIRRTQLLPSYKANRTATPETFKQQLPFIKQLIPHLGGHVLEKMDVEADDLLGALSKKIAQNNGQAVIVSADKDLMQCVNEHVYQLMPTQQGWKLLNAEGVYGKMGIWPNQIVDYLALVGDVADNFKGICGVGPKTAVRWLQQYTSIDTILANVDCIKPERLRAHLVEAKNLLAVNRQLAQLDCSEDLIDNVDIFKVKQIQPNPTELVRIFHEFKLPALIKKIHERYRTSRTLLHSQTEFRF